MSGRESRTKWKTKTESVYVYGREERLTEAYEKILPEKNIYLKFEQEEIDEKQKSRPLRKSVKQSATCGYSIYGKPASNSKYKRLYYRCMGQDGHRLGVGCAVDTLYVRKLLMTSYGTRI